MQGTWVCSLVQKDPTCHGAMKPVRHSYWAWKPQISKPVGLVSVLCNEKPLRWEARAPQLENSLYSRQLEKAHTQQWRGSTAKKKFIFPIHITVKYMLLGFQTPSKSGDENNVKGQMVKAPCFRMELTMGMPNRLNSKIPGMDHRRSSHLAALSPNQWAANLPDPAKVERDKMKRLFLGKIFSMALKRNTVK